MKGITGNPALDAYQRMAVKPVGAPPRAEGATGTAAPGPRTEAAKLSISAEAQSLAANQGAGDTAKVDSLRAAIADGSFRVDATHVAQRMLETGGL